MCKENKVQTLGVFEQLVRHYKNEVDAFFSELWGIFAKESFAKTWVVDAISGVIPNFEHEEKNKNMDWKM